MRFVWREHSLDLVVENVVHPCHKGGPWQPHNGGIAGEFNVECEDVWGLFSSDMGIIFSCNRSYSHVHPNSTAIGFRPARRRHASCHAKTASGSFRLFLPRSFCRPVPQPVVSLCWPAAPERPQLRFRRCPLEKPPGKANARRTPCARPDQIVQVWAPFAEIGPVVFSAMADKSGRPPTRSPVHRSASCPQEPTSSARIEFSLLPPRNVWP